MFFYHMLDNKIFLNIQFKDKSSKLKSYNIYVNNIPIYIDDKKINGNQINVEERIDLCSGNNKIEIICINKNGMKSYFEPVYVKHINKYKQITDITGSFGL